MLIDWFTVIAQVINFLILVWLLKRFLYQPILNAIDAREKRISNELADADAKKTEAENERDDFQQKNAEFDKQRNTYLNQAIDEAKQERQQLLETARQDSENLRLKLQAAVRNEQHSLQEALSHTAREEVFSIARKTLTDLAGITLEQRMTEIFLKRLRELNNDEMKELKSAFKTSTQPLLVRTAFKLPEEQCAAIETVIKETLGNDKQVQFATVAELISGIELSAGGHKIAWSIDDYLTALAKSVDKLLQNSATIQEEADVIKLATGEQDHDENKA